MLKTRITSIALSVLTLAGLFSAFPASASPACTQRVLVLSAMPTELDPILAQATVKQTVVVDNRTFYVGRLQGNDVVLALSGIGLVNAKQTTDAAFAHFRCGSQTGLAGVVFSGVSGGRTYIGDVTVPGRWTQDDGKTWFRVDPAMLATARKAAAGVKLANATPAGDVACVGTDPDLVSTVSVDHKPAILIGGDGSSADPFGGRRLPCFPGGGDVFGCEPCSTTDHQAPDAPRFLTGIAPFIDPNFFFGYFQAPPASSGRDADDMETAAVARVAAEHRTPFIAVRALSDGKGDPLMLPGFPFQFFYYRQLAADNAATVTLAFLKAWSAHATR
jgi:nucleoside phosphorylase